jgi:hypothetical protein
MNEKKRAKLGSPRLGSGVVVATNESLVGVWVARAEFIVGVIAGIAVYSGKISTSDMVVDAGLLAAVRGTTNNRAFSIMKYEQ